MVLLIAYGHRDPYAHFMTQNMEDTFVGQQELSGTREDDKHETNTQRPSGNDNIKLADVSTAEAYGSGNLRFCCMLELKVIKITNWTKRELSSDQRENWRELLQL